MNRPTRAVKIKPGTRKVESLQVRRMTSAPETKRIHAALTLALLAACSANLMLLCSRF
jgi:hypothetical protein